MKNLTARFMITVCVAIMLALVSVFSVGDVAYADGMDFEVEMSASGYWNKDGGLVFEVITNLPDEAELIFTLSRGLFGVGDGYAGQVDVVVSGGEGVGGGFSRKGSKITSGDFDLNVSMSLPKYQSEAVRAVIGEKGEHMFGKLVFEDDFIMPGSKYIEAYFTVHLENGTVTVEPSDTYQFTPVDE